MFAVVAPNGLGHLRRVVGVLSRFTERVSGATVAIACEARAAEQLRDWPRAAELLAQAELHTGITAPGASWSRDPSLYDDGRLLAWEERLGACPALAQAGVVVSDNLAGVLRFRHDAVLMGSFLVSDVLAEAHPMSAAVDRFVRHERDLLARHRPPMLCVGDVVMPGVAQRTAAVRLPWMCESSAVETGDGRRLVGVLGGRTGAADEVLREAAVALAAAGLELAVPDGVGLEEAGRRTFGFGPADFAALAVAVCRPGLGTVNDCISQGVPMVLVHEGNPELAHNAARLADLGVGEDLGEAPSPGEVVAAACRLMEPARHEAARSAMAGLPKDGLDRAASWLVDWSVQACSADQRGGSA